MDLLTLPGVFAPISDSRLLADLIRREPIGPRHTVLDLCNGSGILALAAAEQGAMVTAVDVSRRAVLTARINAWRLGVRVRARRGRTFAPVRGERFDLIVSNPPYVPSPDPTVPTRGAERAWAAGIDGRLVLDEICRGAPDHLHPDGSILLVHSSLIGEDATRAALTDAGLVDARVVERVRGPLGPLMEEQRRRGTIPAGTTHEDVVIIRAEAPAR